AVDWRGGVKFYFIHGVKFEKPLWTMVTKGTMTFKNIVGMSNMEQRMAALKVYGTEKLLTSANAQLVDSSKRYELYQIDGVFNQAAFYLKYSCPSTGRQYVSGIDPVI